MSTRAGDIGSYKSFLGFSGPRPNPTNKLRAPRLLLTPFLVHYKSGYLKALDCTPILVQVKCNFSSFSGPGLGSAGREVGRRRTG